MLEDAKSRNQKMADVLEGRKDDWFRMWQANRELSRILSDDVDAPGGERMHHAWNVIWDYVDALTAIQGIGSLGFRGFTCGYTVVENAAGRIANRTMSKSEWRNFYRNLRTKASESANKITISAEIGASGPLKFTHEEFYNAIIEDPVARASFKQIQEAGGTIKFVKTLGGAAGETTRAFQIFIALDTHKSMRQLISTFVHESKHIRILNSTRGKTLYPKGLYKAEFEARAREFLYRFKRRPVKAERQKIGEWVYENY